MKEIDRMADFFGIEGYQLLSPGIGGVAERRRGERRSSRDRRGGVDRRRGAFVAPPSFRPKHLVSVVAVGLTLFGLPVQANQAAVYGQGNVSCGTWRDMRWREAVHQSYAVWSLGYLSGAANNNPASMATTDYAGVVAFIDDHCATRPLESLASASQALVTALRR